MPFVAIEVELLVHVLSLLPYYQLVQCRLVCQRFRELIDTTSALQLIIEAGAAGYEPPSGPSSSAALENFRRVQRIYRNPKPRKSELVIDLQPYTHGINDYGFGIWGRHGEFYIGLISRSSGNTLCCFIWLGSSSAGPERSRDLKRFHSFEVEGKDWLVIVADPSEDLFVISSRLSPVLCALSMRTGRPHSRLASTTGGRLEHDGGDGVDIDGNGMWILIHGQQEPDRCTFHLVHWPTNTRKTWISHAQTQNTGEPFQMSMRGCVVGNYLIVPEHCQELADPNSHSELCVNVYVLSEPKLASDRLLNLIASYRLPTNIDRVKISRDVQNTRCGLRGEEARAMVLQVTILHSIFWTSARSFILRVHDGQSVVAPVAPIPWQDWGPASLHPGGRAPIPRAPVAMAGLHLVFPTYILDLNKYDASVDAYASHDTEANGGGRDREVGRGLVNAGFGFLTSQAQILEAIGLSVTTGPMYRITRDPFKGLGKAPANTIVYLIEEHDGPKLVVIRARFAPEALEFWTL